MLKVGTGKEAIDSLFKNQGTVDIIIRKITKNTVKIRYLGENFTLNKHGVLCHETIIKDDPKKRIWYTFCPFHLGVDKTAVIAAIKEYTHRD